MKAPVDLLSSHLFDSHLFDSHCHFDFSTFDEVRDDVWFQCREQNIQQLLIPGVYPDQWKKALSMANTYSGMVTAAGLHPWWLKSHTLPTSDVWAQALDNPLCVAVGECGLDASIEMPLEQQLEVFEQHIVMAKQCHLPLIIHVRQTHNETLQCLKRYKPACGGVIHGFSGSLELAQQYWRMGFYLGIGGVITYARANKTREMVRQMPLEALLLETDAPDMPLQGHQGEANSPLQLINVAQALAAIREQPLEAIALSTTDNSRRLFQIGHSACEI